MFTLGAMFDDAKYYDNIMKLYIDELPDGYYEKDGDVYLSSSDTKTESIVFIKVDGEIVMKRLGNNAVRSDEMQGAIEKTNSHIEVGALKIELDRDTAWALCNVLGKNHIEKECGMHLDKNQHEGLIKLGAAIGAFIDHPNRQFEHLSK